MSTNDILHVPSCALVELSMSKLKKHWDLIEVTHTRLSGYGDIASDNINHTSNCLMLSFNF